MVPSSKHFSAGPSSVWHSGFYSWYVPQGFYLLVCRKLISYHCVFPAPITARVRQSVIISSLTGASFGDTRACSDPWKRPTERLLSAQIHNRLKNLNNSINKIMPSTSMHRQSRTEALQKRKKKKKLCPFARPWLLCLAFLGHLTCRWSHSLVCSWSQDLVQRLLMRKPLWLVCGIQMPPRGRQLLARGCWKGCLNFLSPYIASSKPKDILLLLYLFSNHALNIFLSDCKSNTCLLLRIWKLQKRRKDIKNNCNLLPAQLTFRYIFFWSFFLAYCCYHLQLYSSLLYVQEQTEYTISYLAFFNII